MQPKLLLRYIFVVLAFLFAILGIVPSSYAWLSGWDQRIELTTDHTVVDATLSNFPVYVNLSTSSGKTPTDVSAVFDEVGANWQKIAIANSSDTECYVEKVSWDDTGETAELWVKLVSVSNSADENWYLYYDNDHADNTVYVKGVGDATNVWDSNFKMVQHMEDATTSTITDSTSNSNDGTKKAANAPVEATGQIGKGQDFDGADDYIEVPDSTELEVTEWTIELWIYRKADNNTYERIISKSSSGGTAAYDYWLQITNNDVYQIGFEDTESLNRHLESPTTCPLNIWKHFVGTFDGTYEKIYINGVLDSTSDDYSAYTPRQTTVPLEFGRLGASGSWYYSWNGTTDEARISNIARSADWEKASYYSAKDNLLTFGSEETQGAGLVTPFGLGVDIFEVIQ